MQNITIRIAVPADAKSIIDIINPIIETGKFTVLDTKFTEEFERKYIEDFPKEGIFHVAEDPIDKRKIVGFQTLERFVRYCNSMNHVGIIATYVDLNLRGKGIGKKLSETTFQKAKKKGYEKILTYVRADNIDALNFYKTLGFKVIGTAREQAKINGSYIDDVFIEKFL
jgi:L-amino acid N-acyltransferase YncA